MPESDTRDIVDWQIWASSFDGRYSGFEEAFPITQYAWLDDLLVNAANFTPHYFLIPGYMWYDSAKQEEMQCHQKYPNCGKSVRDIHTVFSFVEWHLILCSASTEDATVCLILTELEKNVSMINANNNNSLHKT
jgi:hypothetical protein